MLRPEPAIVGSVTGLVALRPDVAALAGEYLRPRLQAFLTARGAGDVSEIPAESAFHELDFKSRSQHTIDFFYKTVFRGQVVVDQKCLVHTVRYQWSLDSAQCPMVCEVTQLRYSVLCVAGAPAAYTILLPLQTVLDYARGCLTESETDASKVPLEE